MGKRTRPPPQENMVVEETIVTTPQTRNNANQNENLHLNKDMNLNRISPLQKKTPTQSAKDKENEELKSQLAEMAKQAEKMATLNDQYRQRNANLEEAIREDKKRA